MWRETDLYQLQRFPGQLQLSVHLQRVCKASPSSTAFTQHRHGHCNLLLSRLSSQKANSSSQTAIFNLTNPCDGHCCQLSRIQSHLGDWPLDMTGDCFMLIEVGSPAHYGWHHSLADIMNCTHVERELSGSLHL